MKWSKNSNLQLFSGSRNVRKQYEVYSNLCVFVDNLSLLCPWKKTPWNWISFQAPEMQKKYTRTRGKFCLCLCLGLSLGLCPTSLLVFSCQVETQRGTLIRSLALSLGDTEGNRGTCSNIDLTSRGLSSNGWPSNGRVFNYDYSLG